jgi:hypothetical protein
MNFPSAIKAQLEGRSVFMDALVEFQFASDIIRLWNGAGTLRTLDDREWEGLAGMGEISGFDQAIDGTAPLQTFALSGVDSRFAAVARGHSSEYYRLPALVFLQFFDEDWQPLDNPFAVTARQMQTLRATRSQDQNGFIYRVSVDAETPFTTRRRPRGSYYTDRDQKTRYPDDKGFEFMSTVELTIWFPDYGKEGGEEEEE